MALPTAPIVRGRWGDRPSMAPGRTQVELDDMVLHVRYEVVQLLNFRGMGNAWPRQDVLVGWSAMGS